jgi:c-di-GMP-specific phosphodiesterase
LDSGHDADIAAQLFAFAEQTTEFVGVTDPWGRILYLNPAARKRLGLAADITDLTTGDIFPPEAFTLYYDVIRPQLLRTREWSGAIPVNIAGAGAVPMHVATSAHLGPGGEINESLIIGREISGAEPLANSDESDLDDVTGVLVRSAFDARARRVLAVAAHEGESCALVLVTILNEHNGYETLHARTAATVTRALAGRLKRLARSADVVGRLGEGQLGVLLRGVGTRNEAVRAAHGIYESLIDAPVTTPGEEIVPSVGVGVGIAEPGSDLLEVLDGAAAIRWRTPAASDAGSGAPGVASGRSGAPTMNEFRIGMSHGDVQAYALPLVRLDSGAVVGYEGLARWHHRRLGTLESSAFAEMIAETSLASQVDLLIARETAAVVTLTTRDLPLHLYAPISRRLISDVRTEQYLCEIADAFSLEMNQLHLNVSRGLVNDWTPALRDALQSLRGEGIRFVVTDLERASGVERLIALGFDEVHLSSELSRAVSIDADARRLVSDIARIAHEHAALVGAVDVDEARQREVLVEAGCDLATGRLYGEPVLAYAID